MVDVGLEEEPCVLIDGCLMGSQLQLESELKLFGGVR